jgi:ArsR family transcriptional regulator, cadmium/lead-responsive transcriptional repressor
MYCSGVAVSSSIDLDTLSRIGRALADPTRQRILIELLDGPNYPADLADSIGTTRANLSNHLTCLRQCGLVTATLEGRRVRYDLADQRLGDALQLLAGLDLPGSCDT